MVQPLVESLDEVKQRVSRKYLGKAGIHGIGIRRAQNALCVYLKNETDPQQKELLEKLSLEASPYQVIEVKQEPASLT